MSEGMRQAFAQRASADGTFGMKLLKCFGFFVLALLVFIGFVYPFHAIPQRFETKALEMAEQRTASSEITIDERYIKQSVNEAMLGNLDSIFKTSCIVAAAVALAIYCLSIRPPHDCGGINLFNPLYLILVAVISILTGIGLGMALRSQTGESVNGFMQFVNSLSGNLSFGENRLLLLVIVPAALELIFRGIIFSYLEKIHFSAAIVLSSLLYAVAAYFIVGSYTKWSAGSVEPAMTALWTALVSGVVHSIITWRLRSVIPAVFSHVLMAYMANDISSICEKGSIPFAAVVAALVVFLAVFILLHTLFSKKCAVFAYDFPLTKHHDRMNNWLNGRRKNKAEDVPTIEAASDDTSAPSGEAQKEQDEKAAQAVGASEAVVSDEKPNTETPAEKPVSENEAAPSEDVKQEPDTEETKEAEKTEEPKAPDTQDAQKSESASDNASTDAGNTKAAGKKHKRGKKNKK